MSATAAVPSASGSSRRRPSSGSTDGAMRMPSSGADAAASTSSPKPTGPAPRPYACGSATAAKAAMAATAPVVAKLKTTDLPVRPRGPRPSVVSAGARRLASGERGAAGPAGAGGSSCRWARTAEASRNPAAPNAGSAPRWTFSQSTPVARPFSISISTISAAAASDTLA